MSPERIGSKSKVALLSVPLSAIALFGCADTSNDSERATPQEQAEQKRQALEDSPRIEATYFPNGTRLVEFMNEPDELIFQSVIQVCDGSDLLEQTDAKNNDGVAGSDRSVAHPACKDGTLTEEDFEIQPTQGEN